MIYDPDQHFSIKELQNVHGMTMINESKHTSVFDDDDDDDNNMTKFLK